jgi:hypothetical protein
MAYRDMHEKRPKTRQNDTNDTRSSQCRTPEITTLSVSHIRPRDIYNLSIHSTLPQTSPAKIPAFSSNTSKNQEPTSLLSGGSADGISNPASGVMMYHPRSRSKTSVPDRSVLEPGGGGFCGEDTNGSGWFTVCCAKDCA